MIDGSCSHPRQSDMSRNPINAVVPVVPQVCKLGELPGDFDRIVTLIEAS